MIKRFPIFCLIAVSALCFSQIVHAQGNPQAANFARQGAAAAKNKDWDKAVNAFRKAAELDRKNVPNLAAALQQRAAAYTSEQKFPLAIADLSEALETTPNDPGIYERRAYVEMKVNDYERALADYSELIKLKPNEARYYLLRSYIFELKADAPHAITDCDTVLRLQPGNAEAKARKQRLQAQQAASQPGAPAPGSTIASPPPAATPGKTP